MTFRKDGAPYVIAELGANHNGDMEIARKLIRAAKEAGADCVKFQSWDENLFAKEVYDKDAFNPDGRAGGQPTLRETMNLYAMTPARLRGMAAFCREIGIDFASTPFENDQVDVQVELGAPFIKIASMDVTNPHLLRYVASKKKPIVLSTGLASLAEIDAAVRLIENEGCRDIVILHCIALYPPKDEEVNLRNIDTLAAAFGYPVGFSDHTIGVELPLAAVARGAVVIEKHFTLDKTMPGWDHSISADPRELAAIVTGARRIHAALGTARRIVTARDESQRKGFRRSIVSARAIRKGEKIALDHLTYRRPGTALPPDFADHLVGMVAARDIPANCVLQLADFQIAG
ncbi:MAG: N-acetylneuraminate synthase [Alphaproteobacteria bacterium]|nr:N-acetylneuraminate synthase [Alphaproteobacteria bacterium]